MGGTVPICSFAFASGTRISLGVILCVVGTFLLVAAVRGHHRRVFAGFVVGGLGGLALVYGPFLVSDGARAGLIFAQSFHAARGDGVHDITWIVGSLSRLVRWYLPVFVVFGLLLRHGHAVRQGALHHGPAAILETAQGEVRDGGSRGRIWPERDAAHHPQAQMTVAERSIDTIIYTLMPALPEKSEARGLQVAACWNSHGRIGRKRSLRGSP